MSRKGEMKAKLLFVTAGLSALFILFLALKAWDWGVEGDSMGCSTCIIFGFVGAVFALAFLIPLFILMRNLNRYFHQEKSEPGSDNNDNQTDGDIDQNDSLSESFKRPLQLVFSVFAGIGATILVFLSAELLNSYYDRSRNLWFITPFVFFGTIWWLLHMHIDIDTGKKPDLSNSLLKRFIQIVFFILAGMGVAYLFTIAFRMLPFRILLYLHMYRYYRFYHYIIIAIVVWQLFVLHLKYEKKMMPDSK